MESKDALLLTEGLLAGLGVFDLDAQTPQFQWSKRVASTINPDGGLAMGLVTELRTCAGSWPSPGTSDCRR
jgi:hypothetical protein